MKRSAEWYRRVLNALEEFVLVKGPRSRLLWANRAFLDYYGMSNDDLQSIVDSEHSDVDDTLQYVIDDHHVFTTGASRSVAEPITKHDGTVAYYDTVKVPLRERDGTIVGTVGTSRPRVTAASTSDPDAARGERKTSMSILRELVVGMPLPVVVVDRANRIVAASRASEDLFAGQPVVGDLGGTLGQWIPQLVDLAQLAEGEPARVLQDVAVPALGLRLNIDARPWPLPTRGMGGVLITFHDVTQLLDAQEKLQLANAELEARQAELESLLDVADVGIVVSDAEGTFQVVNGAARAMLGGRPASWDEPGHGPSVSFESEPGEALSREDWPLSFALRGRAEKSKRYLMHRSDRSTPTWILASSVPLPEWSQYSAVLAFHDITQMVRVRQELEEFAFVASHDLREPLRMVTGFVQLLQGRIGDTLDAESSEYMEFVVEASTRMDAMVRDLLLVSREQSRELALESVALSELFEEVLGELRIGLDESGGVVVATVPYDLRADRSQLKRLFMNLLANALKFRTDERAPIIEVSARVHSDELHISIADNGIGIPERYRDVVFKMFQRLHSRAQYEGTGLGLALCKRIVDRHGGRIHITANQPHGTVVTVVLPLQETPYDDA